MPPKAKKGKPRTRGAKEYPKAKQCAAARKRKTAMIKTTKYSTKRSRVPKSRPRKRMPRAAASYKRAPRARPCRLGQENPLEQLPSFLKGIFLGLGSVGSYSSSGYPSVEGSSLEESSFVREYSSFKGQKPKNIPRPATTSSSQRLQQTVMMDFMPNLRSFESEVMSKLERPSSGHYAVQATSLPSLDSEHYFTEDSVPQSSQGGVSEDK